MRWEPRILDKVGLKTLLVATTHAPQKIKGFLEELGEFNLTTVEKNENLTYIEGWCEGVCFENPGQELLEILEEMELPEWLKFLGFQWTLSYKYPYHYGSLAVEQIKDATVASYLDIEEWKSSSTYHAEWDVLVLKPPAKEIVIPSTSHYHLVKTIREKHNIEELRIREYEVLALVKI